MKYIPIILEIRGTLDYRNVELIGRSKDLHIVFFKEQNEQF